MPHPKKAASPKKKLILPGKLSVRPQIQIPVRPNITETKDGQGHVVSASCTLSNGVTIGVQFPPYPDLSNLTFTMDGKPAINTRIDFQVSTFSITMKIGKNSRVATMLPQVPPYYPPWRMSVGTALIEPPQYQYLQALDVLRSLNQAFADFGLANSYGLGDMMSFAVFRSTIKAVFLSVYPNGVPALFQPYVPQSGPVPLKITLWGSITRGVIWGAATLGAAALLASAGTVTLATGIIVFATGYDAAVFSDVVSLVEDSSDDSGGGNQGGQVGSSSGGNRPSQQLQDQTTKGNQKRKPDTSGSNK
jgi:hypothetical protein